MITPSAYPLSFFLRPLQRPFPLCCTLIVLAGLLPLAPTSFAENLTSLGATPDWSELDSLQHTMTYSDFRWLLETQYAPFGAWHDYIELHAGYALIKIAPDSSDATYQLHFKASTAPAKETRLRPLSDLHITLDPGHIGGDFAVVEQRSWQLEGGPLIREGDLVLELALRLKPELEALGATVSLTRTANRPVTQAPPASLLPKAEAWLQRQPTGLPGLPQADATLSPELKAKQLHDLSELLFYRVSEIQSRAHLINETLQPDIVLALHINAAAFPPVPGKNLVQENHLHVLINGAYSQAELAYDDQRHAMLIKLLNRSWEIERALGTCLAHGLATTTQLPPFTYHGHNAIRVNTSHCLWARNLLANRSYRCPVIFLEPYIANSEVVYPRLVAVIEKDTDPQQPDILDEYIAGILQGLHQYSKNQSPHESCD